MIVRTRDVFMVMGVLRKHGRTTTRDLVRALRHYRFIVANGYLTRFSCYAAKPELCIVATKLENSRDSKHWVVWWNGRYYDPVDGSTRRKLRIGYVETSFLEVNPPA